MEDNNAIMGEIVYAEALKSEFDMEIQSEAFGFNHTLPIEGIIWEYQDNYHNDISNEVNAKVDFH